MAAVLAAGYVGSYAYLSRRGMAEARAVGSPYFFYVPMHQIGPASPGLDWHYRLVTFYDPLYQVDHTWLGTPSPVRGMTWGLSR